MNDFLNNYTAAVLLEACPYLDLSTDPAVLESHGLDWIRFL